MTQITAPLRIDRTKCYTVQAYAEKKKMHPRTVYRRIADKLLATVDISGVMFIYDE